MNDLQGRRGRGAGWATAPPIFRNVRFSETSEFFRKLIYKYNLQTSYPNLYTLYKILVTLSIGLDQGKASVHSQTGKYLKTDCGHIWVFRH